MNEIRLVDDKEAGPSSTHKYTDGYKLIVFQIWYNNGKPDPSTLKDLIPVPDTNYGRKPSVVTLNEWIRSNFRNQAESLDEEVLEEVNAALVTSKIEMIKRHVEVAQEGQQIALNYLRGAELTPSAAVRLLADMMRVEKESMGIPEALSKVVQMSDEQLYKQLREALEEGTIERIEPNDSRESYS